MALDYAIWRELEARNMARGVDFASFDLLSRSVGYICTSLSMEGISNGQHRRVVKEPR
jgi:hypothetical protein